jgi:hypothetical protein
MTLTARFATDFDHTKQWQVLAGSSPAAVALQSIRGGTLVGTRIDAMEREAAPSLQQRAMNLPRSYGNLRRAAILNVQPMTLKWNSGVHGFSSDIFGVLCPAHFSTSANFE